MKLGLLLIAMGYGYKIYAEALKEKGNLRSLGQWVGAFMMATSLVSSAFLIYAHSMGAAGKGVCPWKDRVHPFTVQVEPSPSNK